MGSPDLIVAEGAGIEELTTHKKCFCKEYALEIMFLNLQSMFQLICIINSIEKFSIQTVSSNQEIENIGVVQHKGSSNWNSTSSLA